jgi:hypothetical protein
MVRVYGRAPRSFNPEPSARPARVVVILSHTARSRGSAMQCVPSRPRIVSNLRKPAPASDHRYSRRCPAPGETTRRWRATRVARPSRQSGRVATRSRTMRVLKQVDSHDRSYTKDGAAIIHHAARGSWTCQSSSNCELSDFWRIQRSPRLLTAHRTDCPRTDSIASPHLALQ